MIEVQAPAAGGIAFSRPLRLDLRDSYGLLAQGLATVHLDGKPLPVVPKRPGLPGQWTATVADLAPGRHVLSLRRGDQREDLSFDYRNAKVLERVVALADAFVRRHPAESLGWDWGEGLMLYALARLDGQLGQPRYRPYLEQYYIHHSKAGIPEIDWSDKCAPGLAALELWKLSGSPLYRQIGEKIVAYLRSAPRTASDGLNHFGSWWASRVYPRSIWVDSLMMYGIFAARWGESFKDKQMTDFAAQQMSIFARHLQHRSGLWKHAWYDDGSWAPDQDIFWLRGNGWAMASVPELLEVLPQNHPQRNALEKIHRQSAAALLHWQDATGLWHGLLNKPGELYLETSGSALIAYGLMRGAGQWLPADYATAGEKALFGVLDRLEQQADGPSMPGISDATMPYETFGYSLIPLRNDKPYGVAALILAGIAHERFFGLESAMLYSEAGEAYGLQSTSRTSDSGSRNAQFR